MKFTLEEREEMIREMAERMKDLVYMIAEDKVRESIDKIPDEAWEDGLNSITIMFPVEFVVFDLLQIVGGMRRGRK